MPMIRPISELRNNINEISDYIRCTHQPVFITKNGAGDMVVMSMEAYDELIAASKRGFGQSRAAQADESELKKIYGEL